MQNAIMGFVTTLAFLFSFTDNTPDVREEVSPDFNVVVVLPTVYEAQLLAAINAARVKQNLSRLEIDAELMEQARKHSERQANQHSMYHSHGGFRGECVAAGQSNPQECFRAWWNSSGHHAIMMGKSFKFAGVAGYRRGENGTIYWTLQTK